MALTLRVTSFQSQALGSQSAKVFGAQGGSIGRGPDNDWTLPDPEKFVSGTHAHIACRNDTFYLVDMSTNGTFINGSTQPVGNGMEQALADGDRIQIGDYEVSVSLDATDHSSVTGPTGFDMAPGGAYQTSPSGPTDRRATTGPTSPGEFSASPGEVDPLKIFDAPAHVPGQSPMDPAVQPNHGSALDDFFEPPDIVQAPLPQSAGGTAGGGIPEDWDMTGFVAEGSVAPPQQPAGPPPGYALPPSAPSLPPGTPAAQSPPQAGAPVIGDHGGGLQGLLQAAGLDAATARAAAGSPALANVLGTLLSVAVQGMVEVLQARQVIKSQFRVPVTTMRPLENNPLKFSANVAQALQNLLAAQNEAYLGPVEAFQEGFDDIKAHQMAVMAGMRAAFDSMIERFDPDELLERFEKRTKRGSIIGLMGKGRYWDMYRDVYEEWTQDADVNFQRLFGDEFARAYEEQMRSLAGVRK